MRIKRVCTSLMAVMLSLLVLQLTAGVTIAQCQHSGRLSIVSPFEMAGRAHADMQTDEDCADMNCPTMEQQGCMKYTTEQLSASVQAPVFHYDFSVVQPFLFTIWSTALYSGNMLCTLHPQFSDPPDKVPIPPRAYLAQIRILLI